METRFTGVMFIVWFCGGHIILFLKKGILQNLAWTGELVPTTRGMFGLGWDNLWIVNPLSANAAKWSKTLNQFVGKLPTNFSSVFNHFVGLALKRLTKYLNKSIHERFLIFPTRRSSHLEPLSTWLLFSKNF